MLQPCKKRICCLLRQMPLCPLILDPLPYPTRFKCLSSYTHTLHSPFIRKTGGRSVPAPCFFRNTFRLTSSSFQFLPYRMRTRTSPKALPSITISCGSDCLISPPLYAVTRTVYVVNGQSLGIRIKRISSS